MDSQKRPSEANTESQFSKLSYKITDAAERIGVSESSIRRLIKRGEIRAINKLRHVLIPASEIERFLKVRD